MYLHFKSCNYSKDREYILIKQGRERTQQALCPLPFNKNKDLDLVLSIQLKDQTQELAPLDSISLSQHTDWKKKGSSFIPWAETWTLNIWQHWGNGLTSFSWFHFVVSLFSSLNTKGHLPLHGPWKLAIILEILLAELEQFKPLSKLMSQKFPKLHFCPHINTFPILTRPLCRDWDYFLPPEPAALQFAQGLQLSGTENITELENITIPITISSIFNMHR